MIVGLSSSRAHILSQEFVQGQVKKEYIARCSGEFPAEEVVVDQPLLTVDRQMGLNIVHPEGKVCIHNPQKASLDRSHIRGDRKDRFQALTLRHKHKHECSSLHVIAVSDFR
jgi:23S rRNA-/tRNA-specific pseudouridylate synthase